MLGFSEILRKRCCGPVKVGHIAFALMAWLWLSLELIFHYWLLSLPNSRHDMYSTKYFLYVTTIVLSLANIIALVVLFGAKIYYGKAPAWLLWPIAIMMAIYCVILFFFKSKLIKADTDMQIMAIANPAIMIGRMGIIALGIQTKSYLATDEEDDTQEPIRQDYQGYQSLQNEDV